MKKIITFLLLVFAAASSLQAQTDSLHYGWRRLVAKPTYDVGVNPYNPNTIIVGGQGRMYYKSTDGGKTFSGQPVFSQMGQAVFNNIAISHHDTNVVLMGGISLQDLYRSNDGCKTWTIVNPPDQGAYLNGKSLYEDKHNPGTFFYSDYQTGVIYKSVDDGATWDTLSIVKVKYRMQRPDSSYYDTLIQLRPTCMNIRPDSSNILLTGTLDGYALISVDSGQTWHYRQTLRTPSSHIPEASNEVTMFYFNDVNPRRVYAVITYTLHNDIPNGGLWRSDDGGYNWQLAAFPDTSFWGVACRTLANGEEEIFVGGYNSDPNPIDSLTVPGNKVVRGSFDSGKTWWVFDDLIDWSDTYKRFNKVIKIDDRYATCGEAGYFQTTGGYANDWTNSDLYRGWADLHDCIALSKYEFITVGTGGVIYTNYGKEYGWDSLYSKTKNDLHGIAQIADNSYCAVGDSGTIVVSRNNLAAWNKIESGTFENLNAMKHNGTTIYAVGDDGILMTSKDDAATWQSKYIGNKRLNGIDFADANNGMTVGVEGTVYKTTDAGTTWTSINFPTNDSLFGVTMYDAENAVIVGKKSTIYSTTDGGKSWVKHSVPILQDFRSAVYYNKDTVIAVGSSETIVKTCISTHETQILRSCYGPVANVWSLRYFGDKGKEKLYMATEAGCFVMDDFNGSIVEITSQDPKSLLNAVWHKDILSVAYRRAYEGQNNLVCMRIVDINGNTVYQKNYSGVGADNIFDNIQLDRIAHGVYLIEYTEKDIKSTKKFVVD